MRKKFIIAAFAVGAVVISTSLFAHHAGSLYDWKNPVTLTGTVTEYLFVNPHTQIHFEVTDGNGIVTRWVAESLPMQKLRRTGWNAKTLKVGDRVTVTGAPHKQGEKALGVVRLVGPAGQVLSQGVE
jgi:hypothetical protein